MPMKKGGKLVKIVKAVTHIDFYHINDIIPHWTIIGKMWDNIRKVLIMLERSEPLKIVDQNLDGRDFVVGDIHGEFDHLMAKLIEINFDFSKDRLFSVGDLVDRGPKNMEVLKLIKEPWFFAVVGNHEDMMFEVLLGESYSRESMWVPNGGGWHLKEDEEELLELAQYAYSNMPLAIQITRPDGNIGIIHASAPDAWTETTIDYQCRRVLWDRNFLYGLKHDEATARIPDLPDLVKLYMGHTPGNAPLSFVNGKYNWIDTGACFGGSLTVVEV